MDPVRPVTLAKDMAMLADTLALSGGFFVSVIGWRNAAQVAGLWQSAAVRLDVRRKGSLRDLLLHWGPRPAAEPRGIL
ncbi:MAG: hypothetical protein ACXWU0_00075 [Rhodoplanes sp.]